MSGAGCALLCGSLGNRLTPGAGCAPLPGCSLGNRLNHQLLAELRIGQSDQRRTCLVQDVLRCLVSL